MLSQGELAERAGTSLFTIQRIERGEGNVRPKTGRGVAAALGVPIEELLPKVQVPLFPELPEQEPAEERHELVYGSWLRFVNGFVDRWEEQARAGNFDLGRLNEFGDVVEGLLMSLLPWEEYGEDPQIDAAVLRLIRLLRQVGIAAKAKFDEDELKPMREKQAAQEATLEKLVRTGA